MKASRSTKKTKNKPGAKKPKPDARAKSAARPKTPVRPAPKPKVKVKAPVKSAQPAAKVAAKPVPKPPAAAPVPARPAPGKAPATAAKPGAATAAGAPPEGVKPPIAPRPLTPKPVGGKKSSRKGGSSLRRGFDANRPPGELLLPGGPKTPEEIQYLLRGCVAAERAAGEVGIEEVVLKQAAGGDADGLRSELRKQLNGTEKRFESGVIEAQAPVRPPHSRRNFQGMVERAKMRRREIGAFLRGLHLAQQETSHMDAHGEASLDSLMQWAARLENLAEAEEREQADYGQFHRILDQLESNTEALIVDVELTLRRLRDRVRA
jgi:hypothetical protein